MHTIMFVIGLALGVFATSCCEADDSIEAAKAKAEDTEKRLGPDSADAASAWQVYADLLCEQGEKAQALPIIRNVLAARIRNLGIKSPATAYTLNQLGWALETTDGDSAAEPYFRQALAIREEVLGDDHPNTLFSLQRLGSNLYDQSKYGDAEPYLRRAADGRLRILGNTNRDTARSFRALGDVLNSLNRNPEAVAAYETALTATEAAFGPESTEAALVLNDLGFARTQVPQLQLAIADLQRSVLIRSRALGSHRATATSLQNLATALALNDQIEAGRAAAERALSMREAVLAPDDFDVALSLNQVAYFALVRGKFLEVEEFANRALAIEEKTVGPEDSDLQTSIELVMTASEFQGQYSKALELALKGYSIREAAFGQNDLQALRFLEAAARNQEYLGRYYEAESSYRRVIEIREGIKGGNDADLCGALTGLGDQLSRQLRYGEAELLYRRTLNIRRSIYGDNHFLVGSSLSRLGRALKGQGKYAEAEIDFQRSATIMEASFGADSIFTAISHEDLADLYELQGKVPAAVGAYSQTIATKEKLLGPNHPNVAIALGRYASLLAKSGRAPEAEAAYKRALSIDLATLGPAHDSTAAKYGNLAWMQLARGEWTDALANYQHATEILISRNADQIPSTSSAEHTSGESEIGRSSWTFLNHIHTEYWAPRAVPTGAQWDSASVAADRTFELVQWARLSDTAMALSQMSVRVGSKNPTLAARIRETQDLRAAWRAADNNRAAALLQASNDQATILSEAQRRLTEIEARLTDSNAWLRLNFPQYAELSLPSAVSANDAKHLLQLDEALVIFSLTPWDCFVWVVTPDAETQWVRLDASYTSLVTMVTTIRQQLLGGRFNLNVAYTLYEALFSSISARLQSKHLLIVSDGVLSSLPLSLLVTERPQATNEDLLERYRHASWLVRSHAITVLPSVSALKSLRQRSASSQANKPYLGIGNPLLEGRDGVDRRAWNFKSCSDAPPLSNSMLAGAIGFSGSASSVYRGANVDTNEIRHFPPLPETASELCEVAASFGQDNDAVMIGDRATEKNVRQLSQDRVLANARIVHFATHGLVAGEISGMAEPALVLTPPDTETIPSHDNDGLLTASEIAQLEFDADLIVLSACNTAAGSASGADALSGLARAFFYAGTRALLVSHWAVNSQAAVRLMVKTFKMMAADATIGRAEAIRKAMLDIIDNGSPDEAHPRYWAPFMVVGEGSIR